MVIVVNINKENKIENNTEFAGNVFHLRESSHDLHEWLDDINTECQNIDLYVKKKREIKEIYICFCRL